MMAINEVMASKQGIIYRDALNLPEHSESIKIHKLKSILW